jgi:hypothetical protein
VPPLHAALFSGLGAYVYYKASYDQTLALSLPSYHMTVSATGGMRRRNNIAHIVSRERVRAIVVSGQHPRLNRGA